MHMRRIVRVDMVTCIGVCLCAESLTAMSDTEHDNHDQELDIDDDEQCENCGNDDDQDDSDEQPDEQEELNKGM
jgi:hypothetical protein